MAFFLLLSGLSISPFVANWVNAEETIQRAITIAFIISLISAAISLIVSLLGAFPQVWQETKTIGIIRTIVNILGVIALITFLYLGFGVVSLALGYLTRALLNLLGQGSWILWKWRKLDLGKPAFNLSVIRVLLKDCFYPFLSKTSSVVMGNSQSFIIALFINPTLAAVYDITNKIVSISCNFVSMANGSFFALFSLTFASKNIFEINNLLKLVTTFFMALLFTVLLYSLVFTKPIVHFWVGLDKYGGDFLLLLIVVSMLITQLKLYFNSLLYSGGLINKSAKLDVLSMVLYLMVLLIIVKKTQIYAIPIAAFVSGIVFVGLYLRLLKIQLHVDIQSIIKLSIRLLITTIPFLLLHSIFKINLMNLSYLVT